MVKSRGQYCEVRDLTEELAAPLGPEVIGMRFKSDRVVPSGRFRFLERELGSAFRAIELDDEHANPDATMSPHSVVTEHLIDEPGSKTRQALDDVLDLFRARLLNA